MKVGFLPFDRDRSDNTGSTRIRVTNLVNNCPDFEVFKVGQKYDAVVFQKYYWHDYAAIYPGIKILDVCDPDWLTGVVEFKRMLTLVDGVVCNTEATAEQIRKYTDRPVVVIEDRHDMKYVKGKKQHKGRAKSCVWFGYSHNASVLKPYVPKLLEHGLRLTIISEKFVTISGGQNQEFKGHEDFVKWPSSLELVNNELLRHDFALLPTRRKPQEQYKSNNKDTHALALGLPVAHWGDEIDALIEEKARIDDQNANYERIRVEYDCKKSVEQYLDFIALLAKRTEK